MAGNPRRRALIAELERRTRELFEDDASKTHLDYAIDWIEGGRSILDLYREIESEKKIGISRGSLHRYFNDFEPGAEKKLNDARARGAYAIVDDTIEIADEKVSSSEDAARARNQIASRQWVAERFSRTAFGQQRQGVQVNVTAAGLHLDALRVRVTVDDAPARESDMSQIDTLQTDTLGSGAIAGAIASEAEVVSIEPAST